MRIKKLTDRRFFPNWKKFQVLFRRKMRYDYVGDWTPQRSKIILHSRLTNIGKLGVLIHEFVEMLILGAKGVPEEKVFQYDKDNYRKFKEYEEAHELSEKIERMVIEHLGFNWNKYDKEIGDLFDEIRKEKGLKIDD